MRRIHLHWTGGANVPNSIDLNSYHFVIDGSGNVHNGQFPVSANERCIPGNYAAHTLNANTGAIGVSLAAMAGAVERPFQSGRYPITAAQLGALATLVASLAKTYGIPVTRQTILTHAEVQPTLGIAQRQKWDIAWLPGMAAPGDPVAVGDKLRAMITARLVAQSVAPNPAVVSETPKVIVNPIAAFFRWLFKGPNA